MCWPPTAMRRPTRSDEADLVVLNTCHIREKAAEKVYSELGRIRELKAERAQAGREMLIAVAGCVAQAEGEEIIAPRAGRRSGRRPADLSPPARHAAPAPRGGEQIVETDFAVEDKFEHLPQPDAPSHRAAASPPSSPCRKAATSSAPSASCPIRAAPNSRGRSRRSSPRPSGWPRPACARSRCSARTSMPITARARTAANGASAELLRRLAEIAGLARLRYTTSHPARHGRRADRRAPRPCRS